MSPTNQGGNVSRGKTRIVKLKSRGNRKARRLANPHECWIGAFLPMFQKQTFRHA
jgi:hypothetical protein